MMRRPAATPGSAPDTAIPSLHDIREHLDRCERTFRADQRSASPVDEGWTEMQRKRGSKATRRRGKPRAGQLAKNTALVKGIYVVAKGLRCAYLVDTILIDKHQVRVLGEYFASITAYKNISFLFEEMTEQVYIVNLPLLRARSGGCRTCDAATSIGDGMLWLQVDGGKPLVPVNMPQSLRTQIDSRIAQHWQRPSDGPDEVPSEDPFGGQIQLRIDPRDLPALSAWLLEYPVGYTFSDDALRAEKQGGEPPLEVEREASQAQRTNLDGEPLVLVKVKLVGARELGDSYDLLAFSYPACLLEEKAEDVNSAEGIRAATTSTQPICHVLRDLPAMLQERYGGRLDISATGMPRIEVTTEHVRLEKVVL